jgi:LacI family transcriptional regulator
MPVKKPVPAPTASPGNQKVSMRDVADRAGVAISSVSRVLSNNPDVSPVMRNRVLDAVAALGYQKDMVAQSMRSGQTLSIGLVATDIANPVIAANSAGAVDALHDHGYSLLISNSQGDPDLDARYIRALKLRRADGLLLCLADERHPETIDVLRTFRGPITLLDRSVPDEITAGSVVNNYADGMIQAVEHLLWLGHRRLAVINGAANIRPARECTHAARRAVAACDGASVTVRTGPYTPEHGFAATRAVLADRHPPTAVIVAGDQMLQGVLRALREEEMRCPYDVSLVSLDNAPLAEFLEPPLAQIRRQPLEMGACAAQLMLEQLGGAEPRRIVLPTRFVPAGSCAPPPTRPPRRAG